VILVYTGQPVENNTVYARYNESLKEIKIDMISDDEKEVEEVSSDQIEIENKPQLPDTAAQLQVSGRKCKSRADNDFKLY
jgi:protein tyrosine/serine phosphatase